MKTIRYLCEAAFLRVLIFTFGILPLDIASSWGGWLGRMIGPRLATSRKAVRHVQEHLPQADAQHIIRGMWDNLGRIIAEYPHLEKIGAQRVKIENIDILENLIRDDRPCIVFSAHMANWEIAPAAMLLQTGYGIDITYRAPNNPWVDRALLALRSLKGRIHAYPKSRAGALKMLQALRDHRTLCFLIDQKYNEGVSIPFFGNPAMTNPAFVIMARKYNCPLIPAQIIRENGAYFRIILHPPLEITAVQSNDDVIGQAHHYLEEWITAHPSQWLWLHRRWNDVKHTKKKPKKQQKQKQKQKKKDI